MFCIVSFVVLSIMGIFSASNRQLAREALDCVFRRVTLRPCTTGFDEKMKAKILGVVITRSEGTARFLNKYFEVIAWVFFILLAGSIFFSARGLYLYYTTGSCNGLNNSAFCVFDPKNKNNEISAASEVCEPGATPTLKDLTTQGVDLSLFPTKNPTAKDQIIFVGCYECDYTRKAYPMIQKLVERSGAAYYHLNYPVKEKNKTFLTSVAMCTYQEDPQKYWQLNDILFSADKSVVETPAFIDQSLTGLGLDAARVDACVNDPKTADTVNRMFTEIEKTKFYGTPTVFINGEPFVGPKPYRVYAIWLRGLIYW
jgi:hypothetical protein